MRLVGVEAGGESLRPGPPRRALRRRSAGVLQGTRTYILQDEDGNIELTHSISAGLDYAAVGPEHAWLRDIGRTEYTLATDDEARGRRSRSSRGSRASCRRSSRRTPWLAPGAWPPSSGPSGVMLVNLSGRGDKDMDTMMEAGGDVTP